ncbi:MAG: hypothetical protein PWQ37_2209 [Candidatus Petromonas sp.]|nr:hypothetical protein [Candidatus Petromonas sp.]
MSHKLIDITEPICEEIDSFRSSIFISVFMELMSSSIEFNLPKISLSIPST